jgi:hypothetical protein
MQTSAALSPLHPISVLLLHFLQFVTTHCLFHVTTKAVDHVTLKKGAAIHRVVVIECDKGKATPLARVFVDNEVDLCGG